MTPAALMHSLAGSPPLDGCTEHPSRCAVCAHEAARTIRYATWQGAQFTDQNKLRGHGLSDRVCEPCAWAHSWVAPPDRPPNPAGKKGLNLRLFSHLWSERDGYRSLNKGDKPEIRAWLRARIDGEAWWCAIADSGQKHTVPWVRVQRRALGVVRFEERDVPIGGWDVVDTMTAALTAGVTKDEIGSGIYTPRAWQIASAEVRALRALAERLGGSGWWDLALWLSQRDEAAVATRLESEREAKRGRSAAKRGGARGRGGARAGGEAGVPGGGSERAGSLESSARSAARGGADERDDRAGGDGVPEGAAPRGAQLGLFG